MAEQQTTPAIDRSGGLFDQPAMSVMDRPAFTSVRTAIANAFAPPAVERFLKSLDRSGLRIRSFEAVLGAGKLGGGAAAEYGKLPGGDQGQIREFYLASLEQVDPALRDKFFKLYAYY